MTSLESLAAAGAVATDVELAPLTTYKFGGRAAFLAEVGTAADLAAAVTALAASHPELPVLVLGKGSNLVVSDAGFAGVVIRLAGDFLAIEIDDDGRVTAGGAASLPRLARDTARRGRGGLEFYVAIPGTVGGAVRMNAGCHGSDTAEWMEWAEVVDLASGASSRRSPQDLAMAYRHCNLTDREIVVGARFRTVPRPAADGERIMREITQWRREHQPGGTFNAGSVFKNPPADAAGRLIDDTGLKGFRRGGAAVSDKHANFFVADADARAQDVYDLVWAVRRRVGETTGVWLEPEVRFAGEFRPSPDERSGPTPPGVVTG